MNLKKFIISRPITPHLTIYSSQITSIYSIWHRITGITLVLIIICYFMFLKVTSYMIYIISEFLFINLWIQNSLFLNLSIFFIYHFLNGLRHIIWDLGFNFSLNSVIKSAKILLFILIVYLIFILLKIIV